MKIDNYVGQVIRIANLGKVEVLSVAENSRTKLNVKILFRGLGYDPKSGTYKGVRTSTGWYRGKNRAFGSEDTIHIKDIIK